ncbi:MAG: hypothetical protein BGO62_08735 [Thiobacillus sp. 65-1402]|nr:MAG: hypothetical protein BGO62_08735 [Thiobacillus sp. 65-1402]
MAQFIQRISFALGRPMVEASMWGRPHVADGGVLLDGRRSLLFAHDGNCPSPACSAPTDAMLESGLFAMIR